MRVCRRGRLDATDVQTLLIAADACYLERGKR